LSSPTCVASARSLSLRSSGSDLSKMSTQRRTWRDQLRLMMLVIDKAALVQVGIERARNGGEVE
jgi:hypothetical protein